MDDKHLVKWQYDLIKNFARFAAALLLGNEMYDRIFRADRYDSRKYLEALKNEGWSVEANGSCEVLSLTFSDPEQRAKFEELYAKGDKFINNIIKDGTIEAGQSIKEKLKHKHAILHKSASKFRGGESDTVIIPLSEYERAYKILQEMKLSHEMEGMPTKESTAFAFDDKEKAERFSEELVNRGIQRESLVRPEHYYTENGVKKTRYTVVAEKDIKKAEDILKFNLGYKEENNDYSKTNWEQIINSKHQGHITFQSRTVKDPEDGFMLAIYEDPREDRNAGDPHEYEAALKAYNKLQKDQGQPWNIIPYKAVTVNGEYQIRVSLANKDLIDEFNVARNYDIDYFDPKKLNVSFDKETNTLTFSAIPGELDQTYEFEAYIYTSGFMYAYDKESGTITIDLNDADNEKVIGKLLDAYQNDRTAQGDPNIESLFNEVYGDIDDELNRSGAQQFVFETENGDEKSMPEFSEWLEENFGERAHFDGNRATEDKEIPDQEEEYGSPSEEKEVDSTPEPVQERKNTRETTSAKVLENGPDTKYQKVNEHTSDIVTSSKEGTTTRTETQITQEDSFKTTDIDQAEPAEVASYVNPREGFSVRGFLTGQVMQAHDKCDREFEDQKLRIQAGEIKGSDADAIFDAHIERKTAINNFGKALDSTTAKLDEAFAEGNVPKALAAFDIIKSELDRNPEMKQMFPGEWMKELQNDLLNISEQKNLNYADDINKKVGAVADAAIEEELAQKAAEENIGLPDTDKSASLYDLDKSDDDYGVRDLSEELGGVGEEDGEYTPETEEKTDEDYAEMFQDQEDDGKDDRAAKLKAARDKRHAAEQRQAQLDAAAQVQKEAEEKRRKEDAEAERKAKEEAQKKEENDRRAREAEENRKKAEALREAEQKQHEEQLKQEREKQEQLRKDEDNKNDGASGSAGGSASGASATASWIDPYASSDPYGTSTSGIGGAAAASVASGVVADDFYRDTITDLHVADSVLSTPVFGESNIDRYVNAQPTGHDPYASPVYTSPAYPESGYQGSAYQESTYQPSQPQYTSTEQTGGSSADEAGKRRLEEEKRQQDLANRERMAQDKEREAQEYRDRMKREGETARAEKQRQIDEGAKRFASQHGSSMSGTTTSDGSEAKIASIGSGSAIPEYDVKIGVDRDFQISRGTVDSIANHRGHAAEKLLKTLAQPVMQEMEGNDYIRAGKNNAVMRGGYETSKALLLGAMYKEAAEMKAADAYVKLRSASEEYHKISGLKEDESTLGKSVGQIKNETNLDSELVKGMHKDMDKVMRDINDAAYACGFKEVHGIKDFNELCKNKNSLNQALNELRRKGLSNKQIAQLRELAKMSNSGRMFMANANGKIGVKAAFAGGLKAALKTFKDNTVNSLSQTDGLGVAIRGAKGISRGYQAAEAAYKGGKYVGKTMVKAGGFVVGATSRTYLVARQRLTQAIVRNGSLKGALKEAGMRFISTVKSLPTKAAIGLINGAARDGRRIRRGAQFVRAAFKRSLPVRMVKAPFKIAHGIATAPLKVVNFIRQNGVVGVLKSGYAVLKGGLGKIGSLFKNGFNDLIKKIKIAGLVGGIAFGIFMVNLTVTLLPQIGAAAAEAIKAVGQAFEDYRKDVEDPRTDTIIGIASEELKATDVLYTEGLSLFIGGLESIQELLERLPFVGKLANDTIMNNLADRAQTEDGSGLYAYMLAREAMYADEMISTEKSNTGQEGFTYFYDQSVNMSQTLLERRQHVQAADSIWIKCDAYTSDDAANASYINSVRNTTPQLWAEVRDMQSINNSVCLQFVDGNGDPCGRMSNIKEILSISVVCFTDAALGQEDFGDEQNFNIENGETIADADIKAKAAADGQEESITDTLGFYVMLNKITENLGHLPQYEALLKVVDVVAEVAEDIMMTLIPDFPGFPDIEDPGKAFVQSSYCLAAYISSHRVYIGYRSDMTTGNTLIVSCDDPGMPHFGYTDSQNPKLDALDHNACHTEQIYYLRDKNIQVDRYNDDWGGFTFREGWAITSNLENYEADGILASERNWGHGDWNSRWCPFIYKPYVDDGEHDLQIVLQEPYEDSYKKFFAISAAKLIEPKDGITTYHAYTCFGHPYIVVVAQTYTMHTGLFDAIEKNPFMRRIENVMALVEASMFDGQWEDDTTLPDGKRHWTEQNQEWAQWINDGDWEKLYNLYVGNVSGGHYRIPTKMSVTRVMGQLGPQNLSFERYYLLYKALRTVGQISYGTASNMTQWVIYPGTDAPNSGFNGFRYGHDGVEAERPEIIVKMDQQGNQELPDHLNNSNYLVWLFASSNLNLLRRDTPPSDSFYQNTLDTFTITSQCTQINDKSAWAPGDIVTRVDGAYGRHAALFVGYDADGSHGYVVEEYAYSFDVDEHVDTEQDGNYPDSPTGRYQLKRGLKYTYSENKPPDEYIINAYGMVYLEKILISDWYGYRPKCYKYAPFRPDAIDNNPRIGFIDPTDAIESQRTGTGTWEDAAPGRNTKLYNDKDDQQNQYERWGQTH